MQLSAPLEIHAGHRTWRWEGGPAAFEVVSRTSEKIELRWRGEAQPDSVSVSFRREGALLSEGGLLVTNVRGPSAWSLLVDVPTQLQSVEGTIEVWAESRSYPGAGLTLEVRTRTDVSR